MEAVSYTWPLPQASMLVLHVHESTSPQPNCLSEGPAKTTCWWLALCLGFQPCAAPYRFNLSRFLFPDQYACTWASRLAHWCMRMRLCVCVRVFACASVCSCCPCRIYCCSPSAAQSKWMTYQSYFLSLYCLKIIWKRFRLLNAPQCGMLWIIQRLSLRPPATVTIFLLFICFLCVYPHRLVGGEKGKSKEAALSFFANGFDE